MRAPVTVCSVPRAAGDRYRREMLAHGGGREPGLMVQGKPGSTGPPGGFPARLREPCGWALALELGFCTLSNDSCFIFSPYIIFSFKEMMLQQWTFL